MNNMEFYICKRFLTIDFPKYLEEMGWQKEEIVSVNCALFPFVERKEYLSKTNLTRNEQILAVMLVEKDAVLPMLAGYEFCGFDLAEEGGISALTNCLHDFDEVFTFQNLNKYGLLDSRKEAERLQALLPQQYPDKQHAYCVIYAIWRKINIFYSFTNKEERREFGGSAFIEIQYCKLKPNTHNKKLVSLRVIDNWQNDSLYVYVDDIDVFYTNYKDIFVDGRYNNMKMGEIDLFGINYYSPQQLAEIIEKTQKQKPLGFDVLLDWLKKAIEYNGFYILGI